ncbi:substrate-binding domain-containing protein [Streptomyces sp. NPDC056669]|uniref:substrate-binding domain-containing protein n=1 Tax=unclassified Streptomyces TaxID=2593676 RepID=UPI0036540996
MLAIERYEAIMQAAQSQGWVRVTDMAQRLGVSTVTMRRDIGALVDRGLLERVYGGASIPSRAPAPKRGGDQARRTRHGATIGLVVPSSTYYYPGVIRGAESAAGVLGVRVVLAVSHYNRELECQQVARLLRAGVDGLLIATADPPDPDPEVIDWLTGIDVPVVLVERSLAGPAAARIEYVRSDHAAGAEMAVEHLVSAGHPRVAAAAGLRSPTARWLFDGHTAALARLGITDGGVGHTELPRTDLDPLGNAEAIGSLVDRCLAAGVRALVVHADSNAAAIVHTAAERGLDVPGDLAIVAYDDEAAALAEVPLTAVAPPKFDVGRTAVETLMLRISSPGDDVATRRMSLLPGLVVRSSCGTAREPLPLSLPFDRPGGR